MTTKDTDELDKLRAARSLVREVYWLLIKGPEHQKSMRLLKDIHGALDKIEASISLLNVMVDRDHG